jgi:hypothetical protein
MLTGIPRQWGHKDIEAANPSTRLVASRAANGLLPSRQETDADIVG